MLDLGGVSLVGVQALDALTTRLQAENDALRHQVANQKKQFDALEARLKKLEQTVQPRCQTKRRK